MAEGLDAKGIEALRLLTAEDERQAKIHDLLETIREQIRLGIAPGHRPDGLMANIQNAVYALRGRLRLVDDAAIIAALASQSQSAEASPQPPALPESAGTVVAIKPLVWEEIVASTPFGAYTASEGTDDMWHFKYHEYPYGTEDEQGYGSEAEAKAAAQTDYEARIRSALHAAPSSVQARIEQLERERDDALTKLGYERELHFDYGTEWQALYRSAEARAEAAEATVAELRKVVEPFADVGNSLRPDLPDDYPVLHVVDDHGLDAKHFRRAAALTKETANG